MYMQVEQSNYVYVDTLRVSANPRKEDIQASKMKHPSPPIPLHCRVTEPYYAQLSDH